MNLGAIKYEMIIHDEIECDRCNCDEYVLLNSCIHYTTSLLRYKICSPNDVNDPLVKILSKQTLLVNIGRISRQVSGLKFLQEATP